VKDSQKTPSGSLSLLEQIIGQSGQGVENKLAGQSKGKMAKDAQFTKKIEK
jgi:hypothetical protein